MIIYNYFDMLHIYIYLYSYVSYIICYCPNEYKLKCWEPRPSFFPFIEHLLPAVVEDSTLQMKELKVGFAMELQVLVKFSFKRTVYTNHSMHVDMYLYT